VVRAHAGGGREILTRALLVSALVLLGCASVANSRMLPTDHRAQLVYAALGDSTVEGVGASSSETSYPSRLLSRLRGAYRDVRLVNLGKGGATSADVLANQLDRAVALSPHLITLSIGPNDITERIPVETYERNLTAIFGGLAEKTPAVVVVNLIPDLAVTPRFRGKPQEAAVGKLTTTFNDALRRRARAAGAEIVDLYGPSRDEVPRRPALLSKDGYHPSDAGYERWAELMWQGVLKRIRIGKGAV